MDKMINIDLFIFLRLYFQYEYNINKIGIMSNKEGPLRAQISTSQDSPFIQKSKNKNLQVRDIFHSAPISGRPIIQRPQSKLTCIICMSEKVAGKFTKCEHQVVCLKCAESHVISSLEMNKIPKCPLKNCEATLSTDSDSIYSKFSTKTRMNWKAFDLKSQISHLSPPQKCQIPDCPGYLDPISSFCQICNNQHCIKCHRLAHSDECLGVSANIANIENIKLCKFCKAKFTKEGGCSKISCPSCNKQICFECLEEWTFWHHGCADKGWLWALSHYLSELCCNESNVNKSAQVIYEPKYRGQ